VARAIRVEKNPIPGMRERLLAVIAATTGTTPPPGKAVAHGALSGFARLIGDDADVSRLWQIIHRGSLPMVDILVPMREKLNVNVNWLLTGRGAMFVDEEAEEIAKAVMVLPPQVRAHAALMIRGLADL